MSDPFRPVSRGEPLQPRLSADWFQGVHGAVQALRGGDVDLANQQLAAIGGVRRLVVDIVNKSGFQVNAGGVLELVARSSSVTALAFPYADRPSQVFEKPVLKGGLPTESGTDFVVISKPIGPGKAGVGVRQGFVFVRLDYTDEQKQHERAQVKAGETGFLTSARSGQKIYWREKEHLSGSNTTGQQWALIWTNGDTGKGTPTGLATCSIDGVIAAGSITSPAEGRGTVYSVYADGTTEQYKGPYEDDKVCIFNPYGRALQGGCTVSYLGEDSSHLGTGKGPTFLIVGKLDPIECCNAQVVTGVACVVDEETEEEELEVTTANIEFACCPEILEPTEFE